MSRQPGREAYTVGWVCALPVELVAARSMLDDRYDAPDLETGEEWDDTYYMGSIAGHNVVIACLPWRTGTTSAAALATRMQAKFPEIRLRFMVGIGGGVPSRQADIRLGDVVVSVPQHTFGGVVQYDMGKTTPTDVIRTGSLASPPSTLLSAATALQSDILMGESKLLDILSATERISCLRRCESSDVLYDAGYDHQDGPTCANCDPKKQVVRPQRLEGQEVVIHHGTIASGNQIMKSAAARDKISQQLGGVLCFEMEAAGLMNDFPCIVIRGISDYADSHKNDHWQGYAAGTAAAYAKELLLKFPPAKMKEIPRADEIVRGMGKRNAQSPEAHSVQSKRRKTGNVDSTVLEFEETTSVILQDRTRKPTNEDGTRQPLSEEQKQQLLESLKFDQIDERKNTIKRAHARTCKWLLNDTSYMDWLDSRKIQDHHGFLWIKGKAGAGKSTLMKFALEKAFKKEKNHLVISFFFNARGSEHEKSTIGAYRSLLLELLLAFPTLQSVFEILYTPISSFDISRGWSVESLKKLLEEVIQRLENVSVVCFIDALDECDEIEIRDMVRFFEHIGDLTIERSLRFLICFSSRHYPHITIRNGLELVLEGQEGHTQDIANYIEAELKIGKSKKAQQVRTAVQEKAAGIFMWVVLVVDILNKESDRGRVDRLQQKLREIPSDLHELFRDILTRDSNNKEELVLCIQWVLFSRQALRPEQLYYAILSGVEPDTVSAWDPEDIDQETIKRFILDCSKGLTDITASKNRKVQFIHESVRDFLLKEEGLSKIWPEYKENFIGQSHERLKQCCSAYLEIDLDGHLNIPNPLPKVASDNAKMLRLSAEQLFPLLKYAVQNIFYHSDLAERHGISQAQFVNKCQRKRLYWVRMHNLFEKFEVRRYQPEVSLLYVLAELDCANLIGSHFSLEDISWVEDERYGCALLAACALGNNAAVQAFSTVLEPASTDRFSNDKSVGRDVNFKYSRKRGFLFNASLICPQWLVIQLLESPINFPGTSVSDIQNLLQNACIEGRTALINKLLHHHGYLCVGEYSPVDEGLHLATENGHQSTVELLVLNGAKIDAWTGYGYSPIHIASRKGFENITMFLLDKRPDLINSTSKWDETPLMVTESESIAKALILRGADIHPESKLTGNALCQASRMGFKDLALLLLDKGIHFGQRCSALTAACGKGHKELVELLLDRGAHINKRDDRDGIALHAACENGSKDIVKLLLDSGANVDARNSRGRCALHIACQNGFKDVIELLLDRGAQINMRDHDYNSALHAACNNGSKDIVELLLERGADFDTQGDNALLIACRVCREAIVELLLKKGANANARDGKRGNALGLACTLGTKSIVELLLKNGADANARFAWFGNNLELAELGEEIQALLRSYDAK